jgi:hypothetical protein
MYKKARTFAWGAVVIAPIVRIALAVSDHYDAGAGWFPAVVDSLAVGCLLADCLLLLHRKAGLQPAKVRHTSKNCRAEDCAWLIAQSFLHFLKRQP